MKYQCFLFNDAERIFPYVICVVLSLYVFCFFITIIINDPLSITYVCVYVIIYTHLCIYPSMCLNSSFVFAADVILFRFVVWICKLSNVLFFFLNDIFPGAFNCTEWIVVITSSVGRFLCALWSQV